MTYSFEPFLRADRTNWYESDDLLRRLLSRYVPGRTTSERASRAEELSDWGATVSGPLRELAEESARPENHPRLRRFDAYGRRVDHIVLPASTEAALAEVEGRRRLGAVHGDPFLHYAHLYLYAQNGEAGVCCSVACTDGMVRILEALGGENPAGRAVAAEVVRRIRGATPDHFWHGAQFVTEIQGGSDVPANRTEAVPDGDTYRLRGQKWFCSNVNADYFIVSARPEGASEGGRGIGVFLVPAWLEERTRRNGFTIDRLKDKLGTRELATAEVTFDGARAYPVDLERGLSNLLRHVLVPSRFHCVLIAAASLRRAWRVAEAYADFRHTFDTRIADFPLVRGTLEELRVVQERALAGLFGLLDLWEHTRGTDAGEVGGSGTEPGDAGGSGSEAAIDFRVLLSLCKPVITREATRLLHESMMLLGGNGIEERFSPLPRLYRDAVIMETWEGPHNVLLTQALRDLQRFEVDPEAFLARTCGEGGKDLADDLAAAVADDEPTVPFARLAPEIVGRFCERIRQEV